MENTPSNSNKEKTEGMAKLFLLYKRGYGEKIKRIAKKHGIEVIFTIREHHTSFVERQATFVTPK